MKFLATVETSVAELGASSGCILINLLAEVSSEAVAFAEELMGLATKSSRTSHCSDLYYAAP